MNQSTVTPQTFDFTNLLPDWTSLQQLYGLLLDWNLDALGAQLAEPKSLSTVFVVALVAVFAWFIIRSVIWGGLRASRRVAFFHRLLRKVTAENLTEKRPDLRHRAERKGKLGSLWTEFDETLVLSGNRVQNSFDAAHFFNTHTLASGITESRLLAAVPGFLTAIGVIGTFMGLQLGLSGLDLSNTEQAQSGINQLVAGASVAFMTSVWGVGLSVLFNFIEKAAEQRVRGRIAGLQHRIDTLFPRANPEQTLISIHDENRRATDTLNGLAEQIGHQMQQAMSEATGQMMEGVMQGLREVMQPALKQLVDSSESVNRRQEHGSERVLEGLIERFGESFKRQGQEQQAALESAAGELGDKLGGWSNSMSSFLSRLEAQQIAAEQSNKSLVHATQDHIGKLEQAGQSQLGEMQKELTATVGQVIQQFGTAQQEWLTEREAEQQRQQKGTEAVAQRLGDIGAQLGQQMSGQMETIQRHSDDLLTKVSLATTEQSAQITRQQQAVQDYMQQINASSSEQMAKLQQGVAVTLREITAELASTQEQWAASREAGQRELNGEIEAVAQRISAAGESVGNQAASQVAALQQQSTT